MLNINKIFKLEISNLMYKIRLISD